MPSTCVITVSTCAHSNPSGPSLQVPVFPFSDSHPTPPHHLHLSRSSNFSFRLAPSTGAVLSNPPSSPTPTPATPPIPSSPAPAPSQKIARNSANNEQALRGVVIGQVGERGVNGVAQGARSCGERCAPVTPGPSPRTQVRYPLAQTLILTQPSPNPNPSPHPIPTLAPTLALALAPALQ